MGSIVCYFIKNTWSCADQTWLMVKGSIPATSNHFSREPVILKFVCWQHPQKKKKNCLATLAE